MIGKWEEIVLYHIISILFQENFVWIYRDLVFRISRDFFSFLFKWCKWSGVPTENTAKKTISSYTAHQKMHISQSKR